MTTYISAEFQLMLSTSVVTSVGRFLPGSMLPTISVQFALDYDLCDNYFITARPNFSENRHRLSNALISRLFDERVCICNLQFRPSILRIDFTRYASRYPKSQFRLATDDSLPFGFVESGIFIGPGRQP